MLITYEEQIKEHRKEYNKEYYRKNKKQIKERVGKLYTCECGKTITFGGKARHEKSKFHTKYCEEQK